MDYFHRSGSAVNVFGTYAQWPSWADYYAEQGLLNVADYPIVQGIDDRASQLPPEPDNGTLTPAVLGPAQARSATAPTSPWVDQQRRWLDCMEPGRDPQRQLRHHPDQHGHQWQRRPAAR